MWRKNEYEKAANNFIKKYYNDVENPWSEKLNRFIGFFIAYEVPFEIVHKRRQIEDFSFNSLIKKPRIYEEKVGDLDFINEPKGKYDYIGGEERKKAYIDAINSGTEIKTIMDYEGVKKCGQTFLNAIMLRETGAEVRCLDHPLHAIIVDRKSICVWETVLKDFNYIRKEGFPQNPDKVGYEGFNLDGNDERHEIFVKDLTSLFNELYKKAHPLENVIKEVNNLRRRNKEGIISISSTKS